VAETGHLAVVVGDENHRARTEAEALARVFTELHAGQYLARVRRGETGAATAYLGGLRRGSEVDPWALLEEVAARALAISGTEGGSVLETAGAEHAAAAVPAAAPE
jgi:hypothetical protein